MSKKLDIITIIAISGIAWVILIISHEVVGHGGAAYINGGRLAYFDSMFAKFVEPEGGFSFWQSKFNTAAGSLLNILMMGTACFWFVKLINKKTWLGFGLWVFVLYAAFQGGCYIAFSQFIYKTMDWHKILIGLKPQLLWGIMLLVVGSGIISWGFYFGRKTHYIFLNPNQSLKIQKIKILIVPWLTASVIATAAAVYVPSDNRWLMIMGGFGNSFNFLIFMVILSLIPSNVEYASRSASFDRNIPLIIGGVVAILLYVFVFGSGITL